jgi:hypothetical protein
LTDENFALIDHEIFIRDKIHDARRLFSGDRPALNGGLRVQPQHSKYEKIGCTLIPRQLRPLPVKRFFSLRHSLNAPAINLFETHPCRALKSFELLEGIQAADVKWGKSGRLDGGLRW